MRPQSEILAVELVDGNKMAHYTRAGREIHPFSPWLLVEAPEECDRAGLVGVQTITHLKGGGQFRFLVHFHTWGDFLDARGRLSADGIVHFDFNNPVKQHLMLSGNTLFRGLRYNDAHRLQLDIETTGLNPEAPDARIILVALSDNRNYEEVLGAGGMSEVALLEALNHRIRSRDPDIIEGHNIFDFDLNYIQVRAQALNVSLPWGRDGSELKAGNGRRRYRVGARSPTFRPATTHGRHIIDTFHQIQRYDIGGHLESYGLKNVVRTLGLERGDRVFVDGPDIRKTWRDDPDRVADYALDDVRDVRALSEMIATTEFYQTQVLPYRFQDAAITGPGEKINALMIGAYLRRGLAVPRPGHSAPFGGGYTELFATGVFSRVVKADVESLYPSIMLNYGIRPASDTENVFLPMLQRLTGRRLEAKAGLKEAQSDADRSYWDGLQGSYKLLINSFYGYLAYGRANFNDYKAAARVTGHGQQIARQVVTMLRARQARLIEADTDGVYFVVPSGVRSESEEHDFVEALSRELPDGIRLSHDGRFRGMLSLKAKNYVLVDYDGRLIVKGSSLRSRRDERVFREFVRKLAPLLINHQSDAASALYTQFADRLGAGQFDQRDICRRETVTEKTFSNPNLRRLAAAAEGCKAGDRIAVYQRSDGSLARIENYDNDEDRGYLLRRLHDMAGRFRSLFGDIEFDRLFPLRKQPAGRQLSLF